MRTNHTRACLTVPHYILKGQVICITLRLRSIHLKLERFRGRGGLSVNQAGALRHSGRSSSNASDVRTRHDRLAMVTCAHHDRPPRGAFRTTFFCQPPTPPQPRPHTRATASRLDTSQGWRAAGAPGPVLSKTDYSGLKSAEFTPCKPGGGLGTPWWHAWSSMKTGVPASRGAGPKCLPRPSPRPTAACACPVGATQTAGDAAVHFWGRAVCWL